MHATYHICNTSTPQLSDCSLSPDDDEKAKRDAGKWWKPWVSQPGGEQQTHVGKMQREVLTPPFCFIAVENNCGYHLFESDSEDEEEEVTEKKEVEEPTKKKSAFQVGGRQQNKKFEIPI